MSANSRERDRCTIQSRRKRLCRLAVSMRCAKDWTNCSARCWLGFGVGDCSAEMSSTAVSVPSLAKIGAAVQVSAIWSPAKWSSRCTTRGSPVAMQVPTAQVPARRSLQSEPR